MHVPAAHDHDNVGLGMQRFPHLGRVLASWVHTFFFKYTPTQSLRVLTAGVIRLPSDGLCGADAAFADRLDPSVVHGS